MRAGDHIRNKRVKGDVWVIHEMGLEVRVRNLKDGTPALIDRDQLSNWKVVWSPLSGPLEGLVRKGRFLVRVDAPRPRVRLIHAR